MAQYYLGYIEKSNSFYNFVVSHIFEDGSIIDINKSATDFKRNTVINLEYAPRIGTNCSRSYSFINKIIINDYYVGNNVMGFFAMKKVDEDLQPHDKGNINYKIVLEDIDNLYDYIIDISELNFYFVGVSKELFNNDDLNNKQIEVHEAYLYSDTVLLCNDGNYSKLYGPYKLHTKSYDNSRYIKPNAENSQYQVSYYSDIVTIDIPILSGRNYHDGGDFVTIAYCPNDIECKFEDTITDDILIVQYGKYVNTDTRRLDELTTVANAVESSPFFASETNEHIRKHRIERISNLLSDIESLSNKSREIAFKLIEKLISQGDSSIEALIMDSGQFKAAQNEQEITIDDIESYEKEINDLNANLDQYKADCDVMQRELREKEADIVRLKEENDKLQQRDEQYEQYRSAQEAVEDLQAKKELLMMEIGEKKAEAKQAKSERDDIIKELNDRKNDLSLVSDNLKNAVDNVIGGVSSTVLSPYFSKTLMDAAEKLHALEESEYYIDLAQKYEDKTLQTEKYSGETLAHEIYNRIKLYRGYSYNDIINMMICISQGFLVVFSGEPGTGKTSICRILAHSLGIDGEAKRFVPVSVERGWSSKRDLIGYYNPLTKKYDKSNGKIFDGLMLLNAEGRNSKFPFIILLDEANLSPMEHYWSDFMQVADKNTNVSTINIGTENDICIPETLHFLATINNDQTTEKLSPRLIDRAWIITLPKIHNDNEYPEVDETETLDMFLWEDIKCTFSTYSEEQKDIEHAKALDKIYELFEDNNMPVSERIRKSMRKYIRVAQVYMVEQDGVTSSERALDFAIAQKLLPKINGHYEVLKPVFDGIKTIWKDEKFRSEQSLTIKAIKDMESRMGQNMGYCQFLK